ncbi:MAG: transglycosylase SLT domain-containing protein [Shewanella sp.]
MVTSVIKRLCSRTFSLTFSITFSFLLSCVLLYPVLATAQEPLPPAYQLAAQKVGVPTEVLYAVALTESGFLIEDKMHPWPWTLNIAGQGRFFRTREDACFVLTEALKTVSAKRVDVGISQINYGYHGHRVNKSCDLLDPYLNLSIAADILHSQHKKGEEWIKAIGRYHSPAGGIHAVRYQNAANRHLVRLANRPK